MHPLMLLCIYLMVFAIYLLYRNELVFNIRMKLLDEVSMRCKEIAKKGGNWEQYYVNFTKVSYHKMLFQLTTFKWELDKDCNIVPLNE